MHIARSPDTLEQQARSLDEQATTYAARGDVTSSLVKREEAAALRVQANEARRQTRAPGVRFG